MKHKNISTRSAQCKSDAVIIAVEYNTLLHLIGFPRNDELF